MEDSILSSFGIEIIGIICPVSVCMLLVVLLICVLYSPSSSLHAAPLVTVANLIYSEKPSDSTTDKLEGAVLNAIVFVIIIAAVTFVLFLLYYYNFTGLIKYYIQFSVFTVLGTMGGSIFLSIIQHFSIPIDSITCFILLFNFTVVGVLSVFNLGFPILLRQVYMVVLGIIVAIWFTNLPEWTTWVLLLALALYDLVAVLAPGGPLKMLVELASHRDEALPALIYEARPTIYQNSQPTLGLLLAGVSDSASVELHQLHRVANERYDARNLSNVEGITVELGTREVDETSPLVSGLDDDHASGSPITPLGNIDSEIIVEEEMSPLFQNVEVARESSIRTERGIKLGLGDFVFYGVLVGRAAMYDLMTVYACYLAIICGLGCTLILLSVYHRALPALPISIILGVIFYFLTRIVLEPFVMGASTSLVMF